jgi:hypothetical protein
MANKKPAVQYYTMTTERFMDILRNVQQDHVLVSDLVKDSVMSVDIENWDEKETTDLIETFVVVNSFKKLLETKLRNPPKEQVDFAKQHNITDVLITGEELFAIQRFVTSLNEQKEILDYDHKISLTLH